MPECLQLAVLTRDQLRSSKPSIGRPREGIFPGNYWSGMKRRAKKHGLQCTITQEFVLALYHAQGGVCAHTGWPIDLPTWAPGGWVATASLDRIYNDKELGYQVFNVQWVHTIVNLMKNSSTDAEFRAWCEQVTGRAGRHRPFIDIYQATMRALRLCNML